MRHPYYGSPRIIVDLQREAGWEDGYVKIPGFSKGKDGGVLGVRRPCTPRLCAEAEVHCGGAA